MNRALNLLLFIFLVSGCSKQRETIFHDQRLSKQNEIKVCVAGNTQQNTDLVQSLEKEKCDRLYLLGNFPDENSLTGHYSPLFKNNPSLQINLVLGNHDHQDDPSKWITFSHNNPHYFFPNYFYIVDYGDLCLVSLDTNFYFYRKKVKEASEQAKWLSDIRDRLKSCKSKIAFSNHSYPDAKNKELLRAFLDTFISGKFDQQFASHIAPVPDLTKQGTQIHNLDNSHYAVFHWNKSDPESVRVETKRFSPVVAENQELLPNLEYDDIIDREVVEQGPFVRIQNLFKNLFKSKNRKPNKKEEASQVKKQKEEESFTSKSDT